MDEFWVYVIVFVLVISCVLGGGAMYDRAMCFAKTENMGMNARWSILGTCQVEVESGKWIPLESYYFKEE